MNKKPKSDTRLAILDVIGDPDGRDLFYSIATDVLSPHYLKLSRKQYYLRLSKLIKADLIRRKGGKYFVTPFGAVIYGLQLELVKAELHRLSITLSNLYDVAPTIIGIGKDATISITPETKTSTTANEFIV